MSIFEAMSLLALEPLRRAACSTIAGPNHEPATPPPALPEPADPRLQPALEKANDLAWQVYEVLLAGPAFWRGCHLYLGNKEYEELRQHAQLLQEKFCIGGGSPQAERQRRPCLRELHRARKGGILGRPASGGRSDAATAPSALPLLVAELRRAGLVNLAGLLESERQSEPLLVRSVQHFFQQEVKKVPQLFPEAKVAASQPPQNRLRKAFHNIAHTASQFGPGLQEWIEEDMSEASATSPTQNDKDGATSVGKASQAVPTKAAGVADEPVADQPVETRRQRLLGWVFGVGALVIPIAVILLLFARYMAYEVRSYSGTENMALAVSCSRDGRLVAAGGGDGRVRLWDQRTGEELHVFNPLDLKPGEKSPVSAVAFSPDGNNLLIGDMSAPWVYELEKFTRVRLEKSGNYILCAAYSPDGKYLATSSRSDSKETNATGGMVRLWDATNLSLVRTFSGYANPVSSFAFSADGRYLAASDGEELKFWDVSSGNMDSKFADVPGKIRCVAFAPNALQVAFAGTDRAIHIWDPIAGKLLASLGVQNGHKAPINSIAYSPDGRLLASGSMGTSKSDQEKNSAVPDEPRTLRVWSVANEAECYHVQNCTDTVWSVAFTPDSHYVLSGGADNQVRLWWLP